MIVPISWITPESIEHRRKTYTPRRFANEVEGWWYKGARRPLIEREIRTLFDRSIDFTSPENVDHTMPVYLGVDWGGGTQAFTVAWIWQLVNEGVPRFKVLYVTKITEPSTEKQADMVAALMDKYQVDQAVMDSGGGTRQVEKLSKRYGPRIYKCHYRYNAEDPFEPISEEDRVNVDRTWIIETIIDLINRPEESPNYPKGIPRIHIPAKNLENIEWIIDHFTCIEAETSESAGKTFVRYTHSEETNDDALHACFVSGTKIIVPKSLVYRKTGKIQVYGTKNIEEIAVGDKVLSFNEKTSKKEIKHVTAIGNRVVNQLIRLKFADNTEIMCTPEHPFYAYRDNELIQLDAAKLLETDQVIKHYTGGDKLRTYNLTKKDYTKNWIQGLTKETDVRVARFAEKLSLIPKTKEQITKMVETRRRNDPSYAQGFQTRICLTCGEKFSDNVWKDKVFCSKKCLKVCPHKQNKLEKRLERLLNIVYCEEWQYVGDGDLCLGGKYPDFVNINGKKKLIELFGSHWHLVKDEEIRKTHFAKYGYDTLFIWEPEIKNTEALLHKINTFLVNHNVKLTSLVSKEFISKESKVYNFEVNDNHNYFANGVLVHNCGYAYLAYLVSQDTRWIWRRFG